LSRRVRRFDLSSIAVDISPLRESPGYRALWSGQVLSLLGNQMRQVAVPVQVFRLTHSTIAVGMTGLVEVIPLIIFSIASGAVIDRFDRRALIALSQIALIACSGALALVTLAGTPSLPWIYGLTAASSAFSSIDRPVRSAILPHLVAPRHIPAAMALRQVLFQVTLIVGPLLAGLMLGFVDLGYIYVVDAVSFVSALVALRWVPDVPVTPTDQTGWEQIKEGLRYSFRTPVLLAIFLMDLQAMILGMPRAAFPALAQQTFGNESLVGYLYAAPAVGAMLAALSTGWVDRIERQGFAVVASVAVWGAAIMIAGLTTFSFTSTLVFLAIAGAADVVSAVFRGTMLLENSPDALRGRTSSVNLMVVTGGPRLGDVEAGLVAGAIGAQGSVIAGGAACLLATLGVAARFKRFRSYRRSEAPFRAGVSE
jgi:MFS family permease